MDAVQNATAVAAPTCSRQQAVPSGALQAQEAAGRETGWMAAVSSMHCRAAANKQAGYRQSRADQA